MDVHGPRIPGKQGKVKHVAHPGQWHPDCLFEVGERVQERLPGEAVDDKGVTPDICIIVKINKPETTCVPIGEHGAAENGKG